MDSTNDQLNANENKIKVFCRFRPFNSLEKTNHSEYNVEFFYENKENSIKFAGGQYLFEKVFRPNATQEQVYREAAKSIVSDALAGYNGTIFVYGQTSSGKTYTMEGEISDSEKQGIIPRIGSDIFNHVDNMKETTEFQIQVSYIEIYYNKIRDLLDASRVNLEVREDKNGNTYVKGATELFVSSPEEIYATICVGKSNRQIAATRMNEHSSRSHSIFIISIKSKNKINEIECSSRLYLVDLAGFEKVYKTGAEGTTLEEAKSINKSLSALRNVILALSDSNKTHIPYRDSVLTRMLQESLGGNAKTAIIVCCSPAKSEESETKSTLQFGNRIKVIDNYAIINENLLMDKYRYLYLIEKKKVVKLRNIIEKLNFELLRWRQGEVIKSEEQIKLDEEITTPISKLEEKSTTVPNAGDDNHIVRLLLCTERKRLRKERTDFHQLLEQTNEEVNKQLINLSDLEEKVREQKKIVKNIFCDCEQLQRNLNSISQTTENTHDKIKRFVYELNNFMTNHDKKTQIKTTRKMKAETLEKKLSSDRLTNESEFSNDQETYDTDCNKTTLKWNVEDSECQVLIPKHNNERQQESSTSSREIEAYQHACELDNIMQLEQFELINAKDEFKGIMKWEEAISESVPLNNRIDQLQNSLLQISMLQLKLMNKQEINDGIDNVRLEINQMHNLIKAVYKKLKQENEKSTKLQELNENENHKEVCNSIKELHDQVTRKLQDLHNISEHFVEYLQTTDESQRADVANIIDDRGLPAQKQNISSFENNIEALKKIYMEVITENIYFRYKLPKLKAKLHASDKRIEALEQALYNSEDAAKWIRKRYKLIVHGIEEKFKNKSSTHQKSNENIPLSNLEDSDTTKSSEKVLKPRDI